MSLIRLKVKSLWQGQVGIRDKYIETARKEKRGLEISNTKENRVMTIEYVDLENSIKRISKETFVDRYSGSKHRLYYFDWKPNDQVQPQLL